MTLLQHCLRLEHLEAVHVGARACRQLHVRRRGGRQLDVPPRGEHLGPQLQRLWQPIDHHEARADGDGRREELEAGRAGLDRHAEHSAALKADLVGGAQSVERDGGGAAAGEARVVAPEG